MNRQHAIRRDNFVDDLIGSANRLLMALWPCPAAAPLGTPHLIPLRAYIERILRTSGATPAKTGPIQCPRRMFISALMLGWKYTQEKSYSSKVWARISGLRLKEINSNEAMFLIIIDWRLYIPYETFKRWSDYMCLPT
ncbi:hypothetical protein EDB81DRAFT_827631 [Dactylonectria macrodidyma]|uniref:Cyclin N-terminal domain-containing protein n=1 Tax=Dactylonectria macrodidyma TaxID=307937 RepID=A0A9P9D4M5_9HYPO|nr:hypothetical protein EDB81DRAFT_827631 [Dactylonectria macrodidyma]